MHVAVLQVPTIKTLDEQTILDEARKTARLVVSAENHSIIDGLGEAVATVLLRNGVTPDVQANRIARCVSRCRRVANPA